MKTCTFSNAFTVRGAALYSILGVPSGRFRRLLLGVDAIADALHELTDRVGETRGTFQLFGADFIVDDKLQPWLTEVQVGPGLSHDEPVKASIIPALVADAAAIGLAASRATLLEETDRLATMAGLGVGTSFQPLINRVA